MVKTIIFKTAFICLFLFHSGPASAWPVEKKDMGERPPAGVSWRIIHLKLGDVPRPQQPAVFLGRLGDADEVYLNGVKIGGEGRTGERFVTASHAEGLYRVPENLLNPGGENLLAVKRMDLYPGGRTSDLSVLFGDYRELMIRKMELQSVTKRVEFILFTFFFIYIQYCVFLYIKGMLSREYTSFGIFMLLYSAAYFLDSLTFYDTGLKTFFVQKLVMSFYAALPAAVLYFLICVFNEKQSAAVRYNIIFSLLLSAAALFIKGEDTGRIIIHLLFLSAVSSGITALAIAVSAYRRKLFESGPVLAGIVWVCISGSYSFVARTTGSLPRFNILGHYLSDFILLFWIMSIKYGLIARYVRIKHSMQVLSGKLLSAHEEERKRLAGDLHDSMGQDLAGVKFNLQRINRDMKNKLLDGVIEEVSDSIKELREITAGLMPVSLKATGLKKTFEAYAGKFSEKTGIKVSMAAEDLPRLSPEMEINIFRVFQEALNNAAKHSSATDLGITLRHGSPRIIMEIRDNGCGFDYQKARSGDSGMGLSIMAERMRVMGGDLTVTSIKGEGTTVRAEAPIK